MSICGLCGLWRISWRLLAVRKYSDSSYLYTASFKSRFSIDKLYPNSDQNFLGKLDFKQTYSNGPDEKEMFSGYIPLDKIQISYSRSSGAGGQNVNKVSTKVEVRFNVNEATWIPEWLKPKIQEKEGNRITKNGFFIMTSEKTNKQYLNQADCLDKIRKMIYNAGKEPKPMPEEIIEAIARGRERGKKKALESKRKRSEIKSGRGKL